MQHEYSGLGVRAVRWLGNRLAIIQNTRNLTNIKPANAPQSGSGLDIGSISYEWQLSQSKAVSVSGMQVSTAPESRFLDARIFIRIISITLTFPTNDASRLKTHQQQQSTSQLSVGSNQNRPEHHQFFLNYCRHNFEVIRIG